MAATTMHRTGTPENHLQQKAGRLGTWVQVTGFGLAYLAWALLSRFLTHEPSYDTSFWLPSGLFLAGLLLAERRRWLALIAAAAVADFVFNAMKDPWPFHLWLPTFLSNALAAMLGAWLVRRFVHPRPTLASVREVVGVVVLGGVVAVAPQAAVGAAMVVGQFDDAAFGPTWLQWYSSDLLGVLLLTPAILAWRGKLPRPLQTAITRRDLEAVAVVAGMVSSALLLVVTTTAHGIAMHYLAVPFVMWAALRFGRRGATFVNLGYAVLVTWLTTRGHIFPTEAAITPAQQTAELQFGLGVLAFFGLVPAVVLSAHRRAERALRASEDRYARAARGTSDGLWDWNVATGADYLSPRWKELLGFGAAELPETVESFRSRIHPEDAPRVQAAVAAHFEARVPYDVELRLRTKAGEYRWFRDRGECERDAAGRPVRMAGAIQDISQRRELEEQLRQAQKLEVIGRLAGGVAHDFNNILTAMRLNLELLRDQPGLPGGALPQVQELESMTERAARMTAQLLLFARRHVMAPEPVELHAALTGLGSLLRRLLGERITLRTPEAGAPLWVRADAGMLDQVILNLCVNARDAMPGGGILTVTARAVEFDGSGARAQLEARPGRFACLEVSDTGCGMSAEVLAHAFEPFFTTKGVGKGTGLGLASVHGIMHQHDGWVSVESVPGRGSTFRLYFPLVESPPVVPVPTAAATVSAATVPVPGRGVTILVVEDDPGVRGVAAALLRRMGHTVHEAGNHREATAAWVREAGRIDLLFTDMVMPEGLTGLELAAQLRTAKPELRVILTSGYSEEIIKGEVSVGAGIVFLAKPFERERLAAAVRACLE